MLDRLHNYCKEEIAKLSSDRADELIKILAVQFLAITGCRPNEAAWVVIHGEFKPCMINYHGYNAPVQVIMPQAEAGTKTSIDYTWLIDSKYGYFVDAVRKKYRGSLSHV